MKKRKINDKRNPILGVALGVGTAVGILLLCIVAIGFIALLTEDPIRTIPALSLGALAVAAAVASILLTARGGTGLSIPSAIVTVALLLICGLISEGEVTAASLMNGGCYLGASLIFSLLAKKRRQSRRRRHRGA